MGYIGVIIIEKWFSDSVWNDFLYLISKMIIVVDKN